MSALSFCRLPLVSVLQPRLRATALALLSSLGAAVLLSGCGVAPAGSTSHTLAIQGDVHGGQQPVAGALLQLYAVGTTGDGSAATPLIAAHITTSDGSGNATNGNANAGNQFNALPSGYFDITGDYTCPSPTAQVYLVATGGNPGLAAGTVNPALAMLGILGPCGSLGAATSVSVNELTSVGTLAPVVPYMTGYANLGSGTSDATQFAAALALVQSYADSAHGVVPGPALPSGYYASSVEIATLGNIIAGCVNSDGTGLCQQLFTLATPPGGVAPTDTIGAILDILKYPTNNTAALFNLLAANGPFQPTLTSPPASWSLPILPYAATPSITPAGGSLTSAPTVAIASSTPGATIFYTTNGSTPTTSSAVYTAPFTLTGSATVKAFASANGYAASPVVSTTYTLPAAGVATHLAFITQPGNTAVGYSIPPVSVGMYDAYGTQVVTSGVAATAALGANPGAATLGGTKATTSLKDGTISFSLLTVSTAASGYTLTVSATGLGSIISDPFTVFADKITPSQTLQVLGIGKTTSGTVTLGNPAPAGGVNVALTIADPSVVSVSPATVTIPAGATTAAYTVTGVATGNTLLTASASNYASGSLTEYANTAAVTFGTIPAITPGATVTVPISLTAPAPTGGFNVNLYSSNGSVATISPTTVTFNAGATTATATVTLTGKGFGSTDLTAVPTFGPFGGETKTVSTGSNTASLTSTLNFTAGGASAQDTLTLSTAAPAGGLTFTLTSSPTGIVAMVSTVTVPAGSKTASFTVQPTAFAGSTTITASYPGIASATTTVHVTGTLTVFQYQNGVGLTTRTYYQQNNQSLGTDITLTSSNPAAMLLSTSPTGPWTASLLFANSTGFAYFYEQNLAIGTSTIQVTAADYTINSQPITISPSAIVVSSSAFSTTDVSPNSTLTASIATVGFLSGVPYGQVCGGTPSNPGCFLSGGGSLSVNVQSSNTAVGTIVTTPVTIAPFASSTTFQFKPLSPGTTNVNIASEPAGLFDLSGAAYGIVATVTGGNIYAATTTDNTGAGLYVAKSGAMQLLQTPPSPVIVTVKSNNPAIAVVSATANAAGATTINLPNISSTIPAIYIQGIGTGTTTLTFSAPGYSDLNTTVNVTPTGVAFQSGAFPQGSTTVGSGGFNVFLAIFNSAGTTVTTLCNNSGTVVCLVNPGAVLPQVTLSSSNPGVATLSATTVTIPSSTLYANVSTQPVAVGTTTISIVSSTAPYSQIAPGTSSSGVVTISQTPALTVGSPSTGTGFYVSGGVALSSAPSSAKSVTLTSSNPSVAVLSTSAATAGSASIGFQMAGTSSTSYYIQGLAPGTSTLTFAAPGYTSATGTITVLPSGVVFSTGAASFSSNAFASARTLTLYLAQLNASTGAVQSLCVNTGCLWNPGSSALSIPVTSSNLAVGTISTSPVIFAVGSTSATTTFVPVDLGTTTISIGAQPAGFSASTTAGSLSGVATVTGEQIAVSSTITGSGLYVPKILLGLPSNPPRATTVTITLVDASLGLLSKDAATLGTSNVLTFTNFTGSAIPTFYIQGTAVGNTRLTVSAPGYATGSGPVQILKAGITIATHSLNIATSSTNINVAGVLSLLDPTTQAWVMDCSSIITGACVANPGQPTGYTITSSDPSVATTSTTPASIDPAFTFAFAPITPVGTGFADYTLATQPAGFYNTVTPYRNTGRIAVNNALNIVASDVETAVGVQTLNSFSLAATSIYSLNATFTATIADPTVAVITQNYAAAGTSSFNQIANNGAAFTGYYVQGLKEGTTTITFSGPSQYINRTITVRVTKSGLVLHGPDPTLKLTNGNQNVLITPAVLNAANQWIADAVSNPATTTSVPVTSSNTAVGAPVASPATLPAGGFSGFNFAFHPVATGSTVLTLGTPTGPFSTATTYQTTNVLIQ